MQVLQSIADQADLLTAEVLALGVVVLEVFALLSIPSVLLRRRGHPSAALSWIFALLLAPPVAGLAWWAFGRTRLDRKRRKRSEKKRAYRQSHEAPHPANGTRFDAYLPPRARGEFAFASRGNHVTLLADGHSAFPEMERAIRAAQLRIHVQMYIFEDDETGRRMAQLLLEKAEQGVRVRVLVDGFGTGRNVRRLRKLLEPAGVEVETFLSSRLRPLSSPRLNFVNHRKIVIVDEHIAFTGGMNFGQDYETTWRDLMVKVDGPGAQALAHVLAEDWYFATARDLEDVPMVDALSTGQGEAAIVASGPDTESWIHDAYFLAITMAEQRVHIATPYFIPSSSLLTALRTAAGRGVDVRIIVPSESDVTLVKWAARSFYRPLVDAGVRIFEYQGPMLHAKALVQDDEIFSVGSANLDTRSFGLSFEVSCFIADSSIQRGLAEWLLDLQRDSVEVTEERLSSKTTFHKLAESAAHLLSPML